MQIRQFQAQRMSAPRDFQPIENRPIDLEIGAGKGKHAVMFCEGHPQNTLYAIERTKEKFNFMAKTHQTQALDNLYPIHADAIPWITHAIFPEQVNTCFILYPNPEPHNSAQRWLNMPFFELLLSRVRAGGTIILASNIAEYIAEAETQLNTVWQLPYVKEKISSDSARTHFEVKYLERGELCQQLVISKPHGYHTRFDTFLPLHGKQHAE